MHPGLSPPFVGLLRRNDRSAVRSADRDKTAAKPAALKILARIGYGARGFIIGEAFCWDGRPRGEPALRKVNGVNSLVGL
jgi:hypothetical protein